MCWAFDVCEGELEELYWTYSFREIQRKLQLKFGQLSAEHICQHNSLVQIISQALGGAPDETKDLGHAAASNGKDINQAVAEINSLLRF